MSKKKTDRGSGASRRAVALPLTGRSILVVDDEPDVRVFLAHRARGLRRRSSTRPPTATEALEVARRSKPDLITLDLSMEGKDGIETFAELRSDAGPARLPVCVVTGHPEFREVIYQRAVPVPDGYMDKPVKDAELVDNAAAHPGARRAQAQPAAEAGCQRAGTGGAAWTIAIASTSRTCRATCRYTTREFRIVDGNRRFRR